MSNEITTLKLGRQFASGVAMIFGILAMILAFLSFLIAFGAEAYWVLLITGLLGVLGTNLMFASYGVQVDHVTSRVRLTSSTLGIKTGKWHNLEVFSAVELERDRVARKGGGIMATSVGTTTIFDLKLTSKTREPWLLWEFHDYKKAAATANQLSKLAQRPFINHYAEYYKKLKAKSRKR